MASHDPWTSLGLDPPSAAHRQHVPGVDLPQPVIAWLHVRNDLLCVPAAYASLRGAELPDKPKARFSHTSASTASTLLGEFRTSLVSCRL